MQNTLIPLYSPVSVAGNLPDYSGALPEATYELCGDMGTYAAVGNPVTALIYRGTWNKQSGTGSWNWVYQQ